MYQIKFLKPLTLSRNKLVFTSEKYRPKPNDLVYELASTITIANDLGEQFFYGEANLNVDVRVQTSPDLKATVSGKSLKKSQLKWTAGKRALDFKVLLKLNQLSVGHYVSIHISLDDQQDVSDHLNQENTTIKELKNSLIEDSLQYFNSCKESSEVKLRDLMFYSTTSDLIEIPQSLSSLPMKTDRISKRTISDILVYEELSGSIARHLWDAGILLNELSKKDLLKFVQHDSLDKLKILELGTGIGLVSIHLSKLFKNSEILATDLEDSYEVCQKNITYNDADDRVKFSELDWESETDTGTKWDLIVITDCTYNPLYYDSLINVLKREIVSGFTKVVLSHKFRESVSEGEFFVKMESSGFKLEKQIWHNLGGQNLVHTGLYSL